MNRQKIYLALVLALIFMSSCGSSAKLAKNHDEMKSDPRIWDYLNVSDRERTLVDSIVALVVRNVYNFDVTDENFTLNRRTKAHVHPDYEHFPNNSATLLHLDAGGTIIITVK